MVGNACQFEECSYKMQKNENITTKIYNIIIGNFGWIIIIIINRRSGITSHTSHGHKTWTRSMQPVRSVPLGGPVVS